jgi:uncharacterized protein YqgC (DUF456 family)
MNLAAIAVYVFFTPAGQRLSIGWPVVALVLVLAILGELIEAAASALGVTRVGGSRRGALLAIVGSMIGGVVGAFVGLPVPVVGSLVAILLFASLGALAGAMVGERWKGQEWSASLNVGHAAFWGRLLGTLGKILVASVIVAVAVAALLLE